MLFSKSNKIFAAIKEQDVKKLRKLASSVNDLNLKDESGNTPLHKAIENIEMVKVLIEAGADPNTKDDVGENSPLHFAPNVEVAKVLVEAGADIEARSHYASGYFVPLHYAASSGNLEVVEYLIRSGAKRDVSSGMGQQPVHCAAQQGQARVIKYLLEFGADIQAQNVDGCSPLHMAAQNGQAEMVQLLLDLGALINAEDKGRRRPVDYTYDDEVKKILSPQS